MSIKSFFGLTVVGILILSCQSNTYQIDGFAHDFKDGDTICMRDESVANGSIVITQVINGKFSYAGAISSISLCHIYPKNRPESTVSLFLEPARITVELSLIPERNRVSGTTINNTWQQLNDSTRQLGQEIVRTVQLPVADSATQQQRVRMVDSLHRRISDCILNTARRNRDNALGQYIDKKYKAPEFK